MPINLQRMIIITIILLIIFLIVAQLSAASDNELSFTIKKGSPLMNAVIVGSALSQIINPKSVSTERLLIDDKFYQEAQLANKNGMMAKYSIMMEKAKESVHRQIIDYAKEHKITTVFEETVFFGFLKLQPRFKDKSDKELKELFDITPDIIRSRIEKAEAEKAKTKKKLFSKQEFKSPVQF